MYKDLFVTKAKEKIRKAIKILPFFVLYIIIARLVTKSLCIAKVVLGVPCPGCGMTRAYESVFRLQLSAAMWWHPLFWYLPVIAIVYIIKLSTCGKNEAKWFITFMVASTALLITVYAVRMILFFPHTEPFTINYHSFTVRIICFFSNLIKSLVSH